MRTRRFTRKEEETLLKMREQGTPFSAIADKMFRTTKAVHDKYLRLKRGAEIKRKANKAGMDGRKCLCCGSKFKSEGPHNRMCSSCRLKSFHRYDEPSSVYL